MAKYPQIGWVRTTGKLTIVYGNHKPITLTSGTYRFKKASKLADAGKKEELIDFIFPKKRVEKFTKGKMTLVEKDQKLVVVDKKQKKTLPEFFAKKILEFSEKSFPWTALNNFWKNLQKNPNQQSVNQLYKYLERYNFPVLRDGSFLAYKYVTEVTKEHHKSWDKGRKKKFPIGSLVDSYTKTYLNNPGCIVAMDRKKCDSNHSHECSEGLHVATWEYASDCGNGSVIIVVKVFPQDVVAVPNDDYSFKKMRVCKYEVLSKGKKEVNRSYATASYIVGKIQQRLTSNQLNSLTADDIKEKVKEDFMVDISGMSNKNKKSIVNKYLKLAETKTKSTIDTIDLKGKTAREMDDLFFKQTGTRLGNDKSYKNKKSFTKKVVKALKEGLGLFQSYKRLSEFYLQLSFHHKYFLQNQNSRKPKKPRL